MYAQGISLFSLPHSTKHSSNIWPINKTEILICIYERSNFQCDAINSIYSSKTKHFGIRQKPSYGTIYNFLCEMNFGNKMKEVLIDLQYVLTFLLNIFGIEQKKIVQQQHQHPARTICCQALSFCQLLKASLGFYLGFQVFSFVPFGQKLVSMHPKCRVSS